MEISLDVKSLKIARQPRTAERRMIMNELEIVETVMFFLVYGAGISLGYLIGNNKGRRRK